jgi:hypothetical protein
VKTGHFFDGFSIDPEAGVIYGRFGRRVGSLSSYGYIKIGRRNGPEMLAHRLIWEIVNGPIPEGMQINHINGIKTDNRIANLELVTPQQNSAHAYRTGLSKRMIGEQNGQARLTNAKVRSIRALLASGDSQASIAARFDVCASTVSLISSGKKWRDVA